MGLKDHDGAFAPCLTLPAANLHLVPPEVPDVAAVFTEPLAAALRVTETVHLSPDDRLLVVGDGSLGLQTAWVLALSGARVHLAGHHPEHLALARPYGVVAFLEPDLPAGDYHTVVEASGSPGGLELALSRVRPQGTVVLKSTYTGRFPLDPAALVVPEGAWWAAAAAPSPPPCACWPKAGWTPAPSSPAPFPCPRAWRPWSGPGGRGC